MKKYMYLVMVAFIVTTVSLVSCNGSTSKQTAHIDSNQTVQEAEVAAESIPEESANTESISEEPTNAQILRSNVVYTTIIDGGFTGSSPEYLYPAKQHNKTLIKIKAYNDGGITLGFSQMVDTKGWGINMEGELEGRWDTGSFSYHDVEYKYAVIKCESACQAKVFEDGNHTQVNEILDGHIYHLAVQLIVDPELNIYFSDAALKNHAPDGKLSIK